MEIYSKNGIKIEVCDDYILIRDMSNSGQIYCPPDNITNLLEGLRKMKKDPSIYRSSNCFDGRAFFPTIGCNGNYIKISHIPRIITSIKSSSKISFKLDELHDFSL